MDGSAIKELVELAVAANGGTAIGPSAISLPDNMTIHDVEKYAEKPARFRGIFTTNALDPFTKYVSDYYAADESALYVNTDSMSAVAILDLGRPGAPLHGESRAIIKSEPTLEFMAIKNAVTAWKSQEAAVEWLEDWSPNISTHPDGSRREMKSVIHAFRSIRVGSENAKESVITDFSASKSALEKIEAKSSAGEIPSTLYFTCIPYSFNYQTRTFPLRVKIKTTKDGVSIAFSCTVLAQIEEQIRREFEAELDVRLEALSVKLPTYVGSFKFGKP